MEDNRQFKILILTSIIIFIITLWIVFKFLVDISALLSFGVILPTPNNIIYKYSEDGRDGNVYTVGEYNNKKLDLLLRLEFHNSIEDKYLDKLYAFLDKNGIAEDYIPTINNNTKFFLKSYISKSDFLLIIYNADNDIVYAYYYYI